jgi:hypothetical protein
MRTTLPGSGTVIGSTLMTAIDCTYPLGAKFLSGSVHSALNDAPTLTENGIPNLNGKVTLPAPKPPGDDHE